jgi:hypothetical protein
MLGRDSDMEFHDRVTDEDRNRVCIVGNKIFSVKTLRINYTTYDVRREQDTINPHMYPFVIVKSGETAKNAHQFWYAQALGVFHASVFDMGTESTARSPQRMEFLWVRWLGVDPDHRSGFRHARLPKMGFVPHDDPDAFGFLDPSNVIRGCHLIPAFADGKTSSLMPYQEETFARNPGELEDWSYFYVNM